MESASGDADAHGHMGVEVCGVEADVLRCEDESEVVSDFSRTVVVGTEELSPENNKCVSKINHKMKNCGEWILRSEVIQLILNELERFAVETVRKFELGHPLFRSSPTQGRY